LHRQKNLTVFINDPDLIKEITINQRKTCLKPVEMYKFVEPYGASVMTTEGPEWKKHRKVLNPGFTQENLRMVTDIATDVCDQMFQRWERNRESNSSDVVDILHSFIGVTLAVISGAGFGQVLDPFSINNKSSKKSSGSINEHKHHVSFQDSMEIVSYHFIAKFWIPSIVLSLYPSSFFKKVKYGFDDFKSYLEEIISIGKKETLQPEKKGGSVLSLLLNAQTNSKVKLTDQQVLADSYMLLFAGHETTAGTLTWAMALLSIHPDVQDKMYKEVVEVLGDRKPTYSDYDKLKYCLCVFQETLRLYPAVVNIPKKTQCEITLGGYKIPKDTYLNCHIYSVHRNPKYWPEPTKFKPERFEDNIPHLCSFMPFSVGPRKCIGFQFAKIQAVFVLAMVIRRYSFSVQPGTDIKKMFEASLMMTIQPKNGLKLIATPRK